MVDFNLDMLHEMKHSPVRNYAIPGLTSWLIGTPSEKGTVRLFECSRNHQEPIIPHSHRFDFQCVVLQGQVTNRLWVKAHPFKCGDLYQASELVYEGEFGKYTQHSLDRGVWSYTDTVYAKDTCYSMTADEVHSIYFSKGALVLLFEGPTIRESSIILEPVVEGETVPTFKVEPWMFKSDK